MVSKISVVHVTKTHYISEKTSLLFLFENNNILKWKPYSFYDVTILCLGGPTVPRIYFFCVELQDQRQA